MPDAGGSSETHAAVLAAPRPAPRARRRVLVTGASGMLGSDLVFLLTAAGYDVLARPRAELDIADPGQVSRSLRELRPEVVVNCAAFTKVDDCETNARAFEVNAEGVANLADACGHAGAQLVQISTDFVFDGTKGSPYSEDDPVNPVSAYGRSKRAGEEEAMRLPGSLVVRALLALRAFRLELRRGDPQAGRVGQDASLRRGRSGRPSDLDHRPLRGAARPARSGGLGRLSLRQPRRGLLERVRPRDSLARRALRRRRSTRRRPSPSPGPPAARRTPFSTPESTSG